MKKRNLLITVLMAIIALCMTIVGCNSTPPTISLDVNSLSLVEGTSKVIVATVENYDDDLTWSSSATDVATVDSTGKVVGIKPGVATITVSAGKDASATCLVNVSKNETFPVIAVEREEIDLYIGGTFAVKASITRNNQLFSAQLSYSTSNSAVATVNEQGIVTAQNYGSAYVYVSTVFEGQIIEKIVKVNVNLDLDVSLNYNSLKLATGEVLKGGNVGSQELVLSISEKGNDITDKTINWNVEDTSIANVSGNGYTAVVSAENQGTTNLIVAFEHNNVTVEYFVGVECYIPYYKVTKDVFVDKTLVEGQTTTQVEIDGVITSEISKASYLDKELDVVIDDNGLVLPIAELKKGANQLKVEANKTGYEVDLVFADKVIANKQDLLDFAKIYSSTNAGEYYALSASIDMQGANLTTAEGSTWTIAKSWASTFDGRGFAIKNVAYTHGLFPMVGGAGAIQNLAVINAKKAVNGGGLLSNEFSGLIENCYFQGTIDSNGNQFDQGGLIGATRATAVIRNVVVMVEYSASIPTQSALFGAGKEAWSIATNMAVRNVIAISKTAPNVCNGRELTNVQNTKIYDSILSFVQDSEFDKSSFEGFWTEVEFLPLMDSIKETIVYQANISNAVVSLTDGDKVIADNALAEFKIKNAVTGVSVAPNGVVSIDDGITAGTEFIVQACIYGKPVDEKTFNVLNSVETTALYNVDLMREFELDLSKIDSSITSTNDVQNVIIEGTNVAYTSSGSKVIVDGKLINGTVGFDKLATIIMKSGIAYKIKVNVATMVLGDKQDVLDFAKAYSTIAGDANNLVILSADIDMEGTNVTTATGSTWTIATTWRATLDGQGYTISNISYTHGFLPLVATGTLKNIAIVGAKKAANGGGLVANEFNGTLENVFIQGTIESGSLNSQGGLIHAAYSSAKVINCVVMVEYTGAGLNAMFGGPSAGGVTVKNVIAISKTSTQVTGGVALTNATNYGLYSSVGQFVADKEFDKSEFTGVWTDTDGLPLMSGVKGEGKITTTAQKLMTGDVVTADNSLVEFLVESSVEGISITSNGVITIDSSVPANTEFKVIATVFGKKVDEKTFKADLAVDKTSVVFNVGVKNASNVMDLTKLDPTLTGYAVESLTIINGSALSFEKGENTIALNGSALASSATGKQTVILTTSQTKYVTTINVATMFINNKQDLITFYTNQYQNEVGELYVLTTDIDMVGDTSLEMASIYSNRESSLDYAWVATFDGQGHVISNATFQNGFFPQVNTNGLIKNVGLVNPVDNHVPANNFKFSGIFTWRVVNSGKIENVYLKVTGVASDRIGGLAGRNGPGNTGHENCSISNSVIIVENATGVEGGGIVTSSKQASCGKYTNIFSVSTTRTEIGKLSTSATVTNCVNYASVQALNGASEVATALVTEGGVWKVNNGSLYFGNTIVG